MYRVRCFVCCCSVMLSFDVRGLVLVLVCWLLDVCCIVPFVSYVFVRRMLFMVCRLLFVLCWFWRIVCYIFVAGCGLHVCGSCCVVGCSLVVVSYLLCVDACL